MPAALRPLPLLLILLFSATIARGADHPTLLRVKAIPAGDGCRVEVTTDRPADYSAYVMAGIERGVLDLKEVAPGVAQPPAEGACSILDRITIQPRVIDGTKLTRLFFYLSRAAVMSAKPDPMQQDRLIVTLAPHSASPAPPSRPVTTVDTRSSSPTPPSVRRLPEPVVPDRTGAPYLRSIRIVPRGIVFSLRSPFEFTSFTLDTPGRLVIDIPWGQSLIPAKEVAVGAFGLEKVRIGDHPNKLRLVIDGRDREFPPYTIHQTPAGLEVTFPAR